MLDVSPEILISTAISFLRVGAIVFALPLIGDPAIPVRVRLITSFAIALGVFPTIAPSWYQDVPDGAGAIALVVMKEILIGILLGFSAKFLFEGVIMAASLVGYQMGFGTANLMVPDAQTQMSSFTALHRIMIILIFFSLDLHHVFIGAIIESFRMIPMGLATPSTDLGMFLIQGTASIFAVALQLSAPILVALLFTMAALGLIARTVPQLNVFTMSFPLSFMIGLAVYIATTPYLTGWLRTHYEEASRMIYMTIKGLSPI